MIEQRVYVHDSHTVRDDGEESHDVVLNTRGETPQGTREEIYDEVYSSGVDPAMLHGRVNSDIGTVRFTEDGGVETVVLDEWVIEEYDSG